MVQRHKTRKGCRHQNQTGSSFGWFGNRSGLFTEGGVGDSIAFRLIGESGDAASPTSGSDSLEPPQTEHTAEDAADTEMGQSSGHADEPSDDYLEPESDDEQQAADDDRPVVSKPADWTITSLREKWEGGLLQLQPNFQRQYVWWLKPELPSRLIESILLEIPIPPLYFGRLGGGKLEVIDGQQRLTTLIEFVTNKFPLQRLTRMPSLNGQTFRELSTEHQEKIKDTPIRTVEINAGNNTELRYEIFERLNRGSMALNEQELRNCVYRGPFNILLSELEKDAKWRRVKGGEEPEPRFKEREMILRFSALANWVKFYKGNLKRFLNDYMANYAPHDGAAINEQAQMFRQTMQNVYNVFGSRSGRLYSLTSGVRDGRCDTNFSIAALEIQASALLGEDPAKVQRVADQIQEHFLFLLLTDESVRSAISKATSGSTATVAYCVVPGLPKCGIRPLLRVPRWGLQGNTRWRGRVRSPSFSRRFPTRRAARPSCSNGAGRMDSFVRLVAPPGRPR